MAKRSRRQLAFPDAAKDPPCKLCNGQHRQLSSPHEWKSERARAYMQSIQVPRDSLVCRPCRDDVTRVLANSKYVPRWEKGKSSAGNTGMKCNCCVRNCSDAAFVSTTLASSDQMKDAFDSTSLKCASEVIPIPTPLCKYHYHVIYDVLHSVQRQCATCGTWLKYTSHRTCPKPETVQEYLRQHTGFEGQIRINDQVCLTCYKSHLVILDDCKPVSTDSDLRQLVSSCSNKIPPVDQINNTRDIIKVAMSKTLATVARVLLENKAMLLPSIHDMFTTYVREIVATTGLQEPQAVTSRWILSDLTANLKHHIACSCKVRKYGTLVYRRNADLTPLLCETMWKLRNATPRQGESTSAGNDQASDKDLSAMDSCFDHLSHLIHSQINTFRTKDAESLFEYAEVDFDDLIKQINPQLWNAICMLTRSISELRGTSQVNNPSSPAYHTKRIRCLFLLCTIMFCTDDRCSMPLHTLLTDTIDSQGGSAMLITLLNRLGVCASTDTLNRFIQYKASDFRKNKLKYLICDSFIVMSIDNLDFLHSFARVYCGHQISSWHGTTVQAIQPLPSLSARVTPEPDEASHSGGTSSHVATASTLPSGFTVDAHLPSRSLVDLSLEGMVQESPYPPTVGVTVPPSRSLVDLSLEGMVQESPYPPTVGVTVPPSRSLVDPSLEGMVQESPYPPTVESSTVTVPTPHSLVSRKRKERSSPMPSPMKQTRSPLPKVQRRLRTGTEQSQQPVIPRRQQMPRCPQQLKPPSISGITLRDFLSNASELEAMRELQQGLHVYMLHKVAVNNRAVKQPFINLQDYFSLLRVTHTQKSRVTYYEVMDAPADSKDTIMALLHDLHQQFIEELEQKWLVVEGDGKFYEILKSLLFEYGEELSWVIAYPGDWHMLKNFQAALMKAYYDAGLKALAKAAGYPTASIKSTGQFKRTHNFILEVWEAIYRVMLTQFLQSDTTMDSLLDGIVDHLQSLPQDNFQREFNQQLQALQKSTTNYYDRFKAFIRTQSQRDDTWRFWVQFVFQDAMAYVGLFLAIRSGDWDLRMGSMKSMAPIFTAFDHPVYQKLISTHVADVLTMPTAVKTMFQQGAFVVSITGRPWHSVAIDESHEMLINKDCKTSIVRPLPDYINRIAHYMPYRSKAVQNLKNQIIPPKPDQKPSVQSPFSSNPNDSKCERNILAQIDAATTNNLLAITDTNRGLINPFTNKQATAIQHHDLMNFRSIGQQEFLLRTASVVLRQPSVKAPNRRKRLQTFSERKVNKSRLSQLEKDKKLILAAMKKKMQFSRRTGRPIDNPGEQLIQFPLAISDNSGNPLKGQKSYTTRSLESRYKDANPQVFVPMLPWRPQCSVLEGMFLINTTPLGSHKTLSDYAKFLMTRHILTQFKKGSEEVHVVFDNPGRLQNTPKYFEQARRDTTAKVVEDHCCDDMLPTTKVPKRWRENLLHCRTCKRALVRVLTEYFLKTIRTYLQQSQTLYVAGGFDGPIADTAWYVCGAAQPQPDPRYACNAEEADTRVWLHIRQTAHTRILLMSPDTDVYHIGLGLNNGDKHVFVQTTPPSSREVRFLDLTALITALEHDPDLSGVPAAILPQVMQTVFVCSGCDYISFFSQLGKATFLRYFFQYATFITSGRPQGTLADTSLDREVYQNGFLAFMRLIGCVYFKKHATAFELPSPATHFLKFAVAGKTTQEQHRDWLQDIRHSIWDRIKFENEMIPSTEALYLHWQRSCWVLQMWRQANQNNLSLTPISSYGWTVTEGQLSIVWDTTGNIQAIHDRVATLLKGCKCATGCSTGRCGCRKNNRECSVGCQCTNCLNMAATVTDKSPELAEIALEEQVREDEDSDKDTHELMEWVFGGELDDSDHDSDDEDEYDSD